MVLRSDRFDPDNPSNMLADERRDELASIFARGILRLHGRVSGDISDAQNLEDSSPEFRGTCLELSATSSPDRTTPGSG